MENAKDANNDFLFCHDCKKKIEVKGEEIVNGAVLIYDDRGDKINIVKCSDCCQKDPALNNFRKWDERLPGIYKGSFDRIVTEKGVVTRQETFTSDYYMYAPY